MLKKSALIKKYCYEKGDLLHTFAPSFIMFCITDLGIDIAILNSDFKLSLSDYGCKLCS